MSTLRRKRANGNEKPALTPINIPRELKVLPQWVGWDSNKRPINPATRWPASVSNSTTWASYEQALSCVHPKSLCRGIGFVLNGTPYVGIDLDKCRDVETGTITQWANKIIDQLDSYAEISPSGSGIHIFVRGKLSCDGRIYKRRGIKIEMYQKGRYLTVTGNVLPGHDSIAERDLRDFERHYPGKPMPDDKGLVIEPGEVVPDSDLPPHVVELLHSVSVTGEMRDGKEVDATDDDFHKMCLLLERRPHGGQLCPEDALATFKAHPCGENAVARHSHKWVHNTLIRAMTKVKENDCFEIEIVGGLTEDDDDEILVEWTDEIGPKKTRWVWSPYIPAGRITILAGDPGLCKSQISIDLVSRVSRGLSMPDGTAATVSGRCIIATAEDSTAETVVPRIIASGGNREEIGVVRKVRIDGKKRYLSLPHDLLYLKKLIQQHKLKILVLDPLDAFLGAALDTYKNHDVRLALGPLEDLAEETNCAIVIIGHLNKKEDAATLYRVSGSIGFIAAARSVLAVAKGEEDEQMVMYSLKANLSRRPPALSYGLELVDVEEAGRTPHVVWHGHSDFDPERAGRDDGPQKRKECIDFLKIMFEDAREVLSKDIEENAKHAGLSMVTLKRYKTEFRFTSIRKGDEWYWVEPDREWGK